MTEFAIESDDEDQRLRIEALHAAARLYSGRGFGHARDVLAAAETFEIYLRQGTEY